MSVAATGSRIATLGFTAMALADNFQQIVDSLPDDWTDLELDLRIADESRYVEAAVLPATCNARPYSHHDWHWRLLVAHRFGHAASAPTVHGTLALLDDAGSRASWSCARCAAGASRSRRCGAARSPCARSSAACGRSRRSMARVLALTAGPAVRLAVQGDARGGRLRGRADRRRDTAASPARGTLTSRPRTCSSWTSQTRARMARRSWRPCAARAYSHRSRTLGFYSHVDVPHANAPSRPASTWWFRARAWRARGRSSSVVWQVDAPDSRRDSLSPPPARGCR